MADSGASSVNMSPLTRDYPEVDRPRIDAAEKLSASDEVTTAFKSLQARQVGAVQDVLLSALIVLLSRLGGDEEVTLSTNAEVDGAHFILRMPIQGSQSFLALCSEVSRLRKTQSSAGQDSANPRFVAFETSNFSTRSATQGANATDLALDYGYEKDGSLVTRAYYNARLFSGTRISGILAQLFQLVVNASNNPDEAIGRLEFCTTEQGKLLPDPTSDLEWSSFRGAIQDIFTHNAESHPERPCVIETSSGSSPERSFTYQQINESSNILAHHLVQSGIERGDVVMVYSHRGVDLVVAVMGILKAGATFSVLDPAYPPERQNIYLEVSQPKALVVIEKATKEAGNITQPVRYFITEKLHLLTEVPALALLDSGKLQGGKVDGQDIFDKIQTLKAQGPGVVVGPDSTPTLSFTSGSEGKPKGVQGRHYSLAFYFDWMAKTFKLSNKDRFTMLSGIAHDPIQRDMFTPLFLGAQLLVPSKEDIQNERLAEWMKKHGATVTHLTPAMGQILVGDARAVFESLHHAFFVGDILIKRDCRVLQSLAPNCFIVNMYGTTETQRAVSYKEIPSYNVQPNYLDSMKDVIPAGKGMYNVQLLVVNRFDRSKLCAVGEIGEIYVRASGLAEGYLGNPDLTETKFVKNWFPGHEKGVEADKKRFSATLVKEPWSKFYLGPRDRLYRSGDLGRYTPFGEVECSGRADDQVKIRGFRIELGEIDTHLSQHPLIRENVTLVRRDKFEEQILVSYIVPKIKNWSSFLSSQGRKDQEDDGSLGSRFERFRLLQQDVQAYLRTKLPIYAVPTLIVPMVAMPLNPNGKVDKPKLPFPDTTLVAASRRRRSSHATKMSDTELALAKIWSEVIPHQIIAKTIKPAESFFELGGNSLHAQMLPFRIRKRWPGVDITISRIYGQPSLKEMAAAIDQAQAADSFEGGIETGAQMNGTNGVPEVAPINYSDDAAELVKLLPSSFVPSAAPTKHESPCVFLTGATGFLGAFLIRDLLERQDPEVKVVALVRAKDPQTAMNRVKDTCNAYGVWSDDWEGRVQCLVGSLGKPKFGLSDEQWNEVCSRVDVVIHNGAQVHWLDPYSVLKPSNVLGTIDAVHLCASGKPKSFAFVSSTSVLDTDHFVRESEKIIAAKGHGISESDDLTGSKMGLGTGYGQSKWAAEYLVREAGRRGLAGYIVRPGYVLGDSTSGVTNTDDFLIRMLKGCIQLKSHPNIANSINMVPVDHVARVVVACAFNPDPSGLKVAQVTSHPRLTFNSFLGALRSYGYKVPMVDYIPWTTALDNYVSHQSDLALMSLFTFVANDLPSNTKAPEMDDANTRRVLRADEKWSGEDVSEGSGVSKATIGVYIAYLVAIGFLPPAASSRLKIDISDTQREALHRVGGRGVLGAQENPHSAKS